MLGLLALWLEKSQDIDCAERDAHACRKLKRLLGSAAFYEQRKAARQRLKAVPHAHILFLLAEPPHADGEDSEQEVVG